MRLAVGDWILDKTENHIIHIDTQQVVKLEPRAIDVLYYFANKPNQLVTRDELIEHVWAGRTVGDHAVYRVINQIRKCLDSNDKDSYITTIQRRGYKLTQPVKHLAQESQAINSPVTADQILVDSLEVQSKQSNKLIVLLLISILAVAAYFLWNELVAPRLDYYQRPFYSEVLPLHIASQFEEYPAYSRDGKYVLYSQKKSVSSPYNIFVLDLDTQETRQITDSLLNDVHARASDNVNTVVYKAIQAHSCEIKLLSLEAESGTYQERKLFTCEHNEDMDFSVSSDGKTLYHTYRDEVYTTNRIFAYQIDTGKRQLLTDINENSAVGDHTLSLSPDGKKLAFLRNVRKDNTQIGIYDIDSSVEEIVHQSGKYLFRMSWDNSGENILVMGDRITIERYSIKHDYLTTVAKSLATPLLNFDHSPVHEEILVVDKNEEFNLYDFELQQCRQSGCDTKKATADNVFFTSEFYSVYPVSAKSSDKIAFVSRASGKEQIWVYDGSHSFQVSDFENSQVISHMAWSPDDTTIATYFPDGIYLVDVKNRASEKLAVDNSYTNLHFPMWSRSGKEVYFASDKSGDFAVYAYALDNGQITKVTNDGIVLIYPDQENGSYFFIKAHDKGLWYQSEEGEQSQIILDFSFDDYRALSINADAIYYLSADIRNVQRYPRTQAIATGVNIQSNRRISNFSVTQGDNKIIFADRKPLRQKIKRLGLSQ